MMTDWILFCFFLYTWGEFDIISGACKVHIFFYPKLIKIKHKSHIYGLNMELQWTAESMSIQFTVNPTTNTHGTIHIALKYSQNSQEQGGKEFKKLQIKVHWLLRGEVPPRSATCPSWFQNRRGARRMRAMQMCLRNKRTRVSLICCDTEWHSRHSGFQYKSTLMIQPNQKSFWGKLRSFVRASIFLLPSLSLSLVFFSFLCVFCCIADVAEGLHLKLMHAHLNSRYTKGTKCWKNKKLQ